MQAALLAAVAFAATEDAEVLRLRQEVAALRRQLGVQPKVNADACSGQGFYYTDVDACKCFSCFAGTRCERLVDGCVVDDGPGDPQLFEEYWRATSLFTSEHGYYRMPYELQNMYGATEVPVQGELLPELVKTIISLHKRVGNIANPEKKNVIIGSGGTELIGAATWACKQLYGANKHMNLFAKPPYYSGYTDNYVGLGATNYTFTTDTHLDTSSVVEMVTYPNNPTNEFRQPQYPGAPCTIHDQVYWWPSIVNITEGGAPLSTTISLFSMSKLTGHAGTRFGWALVDDDRLAKLMAQYVSYVQLGVSVDSQLRTYNVLNYLQNVDNLRFFEWVHHKFEARWRVINEVFGGKQKRFVQHSRPGGYYAWVECMLPEERNDCFSAFRAVGVAPSPGPKFGGSKAFVRLEMVQPDPVFNVMAQRLQRLL